MRWLHILEGFESYFGCSFGFNLKKTLIRTTHICNYVHHDFHNFDVKLIFLGYQNVSLEEVKCQI